MRDKDIMPIRRRKGGLTPFDLFDDLFNTNWMDNFFNNSSWASYTSGLNADIKETDKEYIIEADMPGVDKKDIEIELVDDRLTISAKRDEQTNEEKDNYIRKERHYGQASRSFLVQGVKNDEVTAEYDNGVLRVIMPKTEESRNRGRRIDIN